MNVLEQECVTSSRERSPDATVSAVEGEAPQRGLQTLGCRSFWKAGNLEASSAGHSRAADALPHAPDFDRARVHPKFLHTNATSHKWAFGAIAELLDNAVDEIHNGATFVSIDRITNLKDNSPMLLFQDDGGGMDPEGIRRCMSLGFSNKRSKTRIGQYGNGFKTSTMRLGADAIVFTRATRGSQETMSIGLLSYTFLRRTMKDDIIVPLLDFKVVEGQIVPLISDLYDAWDNNLNMILNWSPFSSQEQLLFQFEDMGSHGTKVLIFNLWMNDDGLLELDFDDDDEDILLRDQAKNGGFSKYDKEVVKSHISYTLKYSLRAYASILYLRKFSNFQIILRGKPIEQLNIADELKYSKTVTYKPQVGINAEEVSVRITIGFAKEAPVLGIFGLNVYHKNRLIMPFWKVVQEGSSRGRCVVGLLEANFIEPAHDKQDFERTQLFIRLETKLRQIILDFWKNNCHLIGYQSADITREKQKLKSSYLHAQKSQPTTTSAQFAVHAEQEFETEGTITGLRVNYQNYPAEHMIGLAACDGGQKYFQDCRAGESDLQLDCEVVESMDFLDASTIEKLCEENIRLFWRREEMQQKQPELKKTVEKLEQELEEAKQKYSQLAADLEARKKQRAVK